MADFHTQASVYLGVVIFGEAYISDGSFDFKDTNSHSGCHLSYPFADIVKAEFSLNNKKKIKNDFAIILKNNTKIRFSSENAGKIAKQLALQIGKHRLIIHPSLKDWFINRLKS